jgi:hypothetical protein
VSNGYYLELLDNQTHLGNQTTYTHFTRHIVNESGVQNASEVSVSFAPAYQQVTFHKVALIREGRVINHLSASQIKVVQEETDASDYEYNGEKRAFIVLKDVRKEDKIDVAYSITGFNPVFANKYSHTVYFTKGTSVCNYFETILVPAGRKLNFQAMNQAPAATTQQANGLTIYRWINPPVGQWEDQPGVPSWFDTYPYVSMTEYNNWKEVTDWALSTFNHYNYPLSEDLKNKIAAWRVQSKGDRNRFAKLAIQFVQEQVRYLGMEIGANTHQPHQPAEVFKQRFGDCKDKALLLTMILRSENIPACMALVNTTLRDHVAGAQPSPSVFNHVIVAVQQSSGWRFIDATSTSQQGDLTSRYIPAYGQVLIVQENNTSLTPVVPGPAHKIVVTETLDVKKGNKGNTQLSVESRYEGGAADNTRSTLAETSWSDIQKDYLKYYTKLFPGIRKEEDISVTDDSLHNYMTVKESYLIPELWQAGETKETFEVFARTIYDYLPNNPSNLVKDLPQALGYPRNVEYTLVLKMPEDWPLNAEAMHIKNDSYEYTFTPFIEGNIITLQYSFHTFKDHIPAAEIAQYKSDYKKLAATLNFELYRNAGLNNTTPASDAISTASTSDIQSKAVWFTIIFLLALIPLYRHLDQRSEPVELTRSSGLPIRGWTAVLGFSIACAAVANIVSTFNSGYFSKSTWMAVYNLGGSSVENVLYVELGLSVFWALNACALLYWFIRRRDIFPNMFIAYILTSLLGQLALMLIYSRVPDGVFGKNLADTRVSPFYKSLVYGAIWVTYVFRSARVKNTFIRNFRGESFSTGNQEQYDDNETTQEDCSKTG